MKRVVPDSLSRLTSGGSRQWRENETPHRLGWQILVAAVVASAFALVTKTAAEAPQSERQESARRFTFGDGRISFQAPAGFTALNAEQLALKYPRQPAPRQAVGNDRGTTSIAYDLLDLQAPSNDLEAARKMLMGNFAPLPNLKWVASDVRRVGGRDWAYVEFTHAVADQDIHNIVLLSVYDGRVLIFNFNSTVVEFPRVAQALRASIATIMAKP